MTDVAGSKSFFSFRVAIFQARERRMASNGSSLSDISDKIIVTSSERQFVSFSLQKLSESITDRRTPYISGDSAFSC